MALVICCACSCASTGTQVGQDTIDLVAGELAGVVEVAAVGGEPDNVEVWVIGEIPAGVPDQIGQHPIRLTRVHGDFYTLADQAIFEQKITSVLSEYFAQPRKVVTRRQPPDH